MLEDRTANGFSLSYNRALVGELQLVGATQRTLKVALELPDWPLDTAGADMVVNVVWVKFRVRVLMARCWLDSRGRSGAAWGGTLAAYRSRYPTFLPYSTE